MIAVIVDMQRDWTRQEVKDAAEVVSWFLVKSGEYQLAAAVVGRMMRYLELELQGEESPTEDLDAT